MRQTEPISGPACLSVLPGLCLIIGYRDGIHGNDVKREKS